MSRVIPGPSVRFPFKKRSTPTTASKSPSEKQVASTEKIAYELYQNRLLLKRPGNSEQDWAIAQKIVKNPIRKALYCCHRPFIQLEKNTWEPLLAWANNQALLSLLGLVGNISLIIVAATYIGSEKQRRDAEVLNAWQTITSAHGQAGSGGRIEALEFLNASPGANWRRKFPWFCAPVKFCLWPAERLSGLDLSLENTDSVIVNNHNESSEDFPFDEKGRGAYLLGIQLPRAALRDANLSEAFLGSANLSKAYLVLANLSNAILGRANLSEADLGFANLSGAYLWSANLSGADLREANLSGAFMEEANLSEADLRTANLSGANLSGADLERAKELTTEQLTQAKLCQTKLPEYIDLPKDRDCEELGLYN